MIRNLIGLFVIAALVGLGSAGVYQVNAVWALQPDGSYDVYCPVTWGSKNIQVRYESVYFRYSDPNVYLHCGQCYSDYMICKDVFSPCPAGAISP